MMMKLTITWRFDDSDVDDEIDHIVLQDVLVPMMRFGRPPWLAIIPYHDLSFLCRSQWWWWRWRSWPWWWWYWWWYWTRWIVNKQNFLEFNKFRKWFQGSEKSPDIWYILIDHIYLVSWICSLCFFQIHFTFLNNSSAPDVERSDPLKPFHRSTNGPWPLKTIETNGSTTQKPIKTIDVNDQSAKKFNGDGFLKNHWNCRWSLQCI